MRALCAPAAAPAPQKRKGGTDPKDRERAVKRTKTALADRELEMAPDAITAPRAPVWSGALSLSRLAHAAALRCTLRCAAPHRAAARVCGLWLRAR
jgi:hypothetical protein